MSSIVHIPLVLINKVLFGNTHLSQLEPADNGSLRYAVQSEQGKRALLLPNAA